MNAWIALVGLACVVVAALVPMWAREGLREVDARRGRYGSARGAKAAILAQAVLSAAIALTCALLAASHLGLDSRAMAVFAGYRLQSHR